MKNVLQLLLVGKLLKKTNNSEGVLPRNFTQKKLQNSLWRGKHISVAYFAVNLIEIKVLDLQENR